MIKQDYLRDKIKEQFQQEGNNIYRNNAEFITANIKDIDSKDIIPVNINSIEKGKFYFIFYDLSGKSSKMEKFNPLFVIDWFDMDGTRMLFGISINFIPINIRTILFNTICNGNLKVLEDNLKYDIENQYAFKDIGFNNIYKLLTSIGFEWSIRKFDMRLINKVYCVSTTILAEFITMSTASFTGVDDLKLIDIWKKKIVEQEERHKRIIKELLGDYKKMSSELNEKYMSLEDRNDNLQESLNIIKNNF